MEFCEIICVCHPQKFHVSIMQVWEGGGELNDYLFWISSPPHKWQNKNPPRILPYVYSVVLSK